MGHIRSKRLLSADVYNLPPFPSKNLQYHTIVLLCDYADLLSNYLLQMNVMQMKIEIHRFLQSGLIEFEF